MCQLAWHPSCSNRVRDQLFTDPEARGPLSEIDIPHSSEDVASAFSSFGLTGLSSPTISLCSLCDHVKKELEDHASAEREAAADTAAETADGMDMDIDDIVASEVGSDD